MGRRLRLHRRRRRSVAFATCLPRPLQLRRHGPLSGQRDEQERALRGYGNADYLLQLALPVARYAAAGRQRAAACKAHPLHARCHQLYAHGRGRMRIYDCLNIAAHRPAYARLQRPTAQEHRTEPRDVRPSGDARHRRRYALGGGAATDRSRNHTRGGRSRSRHSQRRGRRAGQRHPLRLSLQRHVEPHGHRDAATCCQRME